MFIFTGELEDFVESCRRECYNGKRKNREPGGCSSVFGGTPLQMKEGVLYISDQMIGRKNISRERYSQI